MSLNYVIINMVKGDSDMINSSMVDTVYDKSNSIDSLKKIVKVEPKDYKNVLEAGKALNIDNLSGNDNKDNDVMSIDTDSSDDSLTVLDREWVDGMFLVPLKYKNPKGEMTDSLEKRYRNIRNMSTADHKYWDSSIGGGIAINMRPQLTRYADIRRRGRLESNKKVTVGAINFKTGQGRYYSEAIDDNATDVFLEFGVPKFNSLFGHLTNSIDYVDSVISNTGRSPIGYLIGKGIGTVVGGLFLFHRYGVMVAGGLLGGFGMKNLSDKVLLGQNTFKYYYVNPTMFLYWSAVNNIMIEFTMGMGILTPQQSDKSQDVVSRTLSSGATAFGKSTKTDDNKLRLGAGMTLNQNDLDVISKLIPDIVSGTEDGKATGYIDIFALVSRRQRLLTKQREKDDKLARENPKEYIEKVNARYLDNTKPGDNEVSLDDEIGKEVSYLGTLSTYIDEAGWGKSANQILNDLSEEADAAIAEAKALASEAIDGVKSLAGTVVSSIMTPKTDGESMASGVMDTISKVTENAALLMESAENKFKSSKLVGDKDIKKASNDINKTNGWFNSFVSTADAFARSGGKYAIFRVDNVGSMSDSISNSVVDIDMGMGMLSGMGKRAKSVSFNLSGGNIIPGMQEMLGYAKDVVAGGLSGATMGLTDIIPALLGDAYLDNPKRWDDSDMQIATTSYSMQLVSPSAHPIAQLQNIYIPLAMLMAGSLPLSTGPNGYTSPFICKLYSKGISKIDLGMITSVTIKRGNTNLTHDTNKKVLGIDVSFTVTDFSKIMTATANGGLFSPLGGVKVDDSKLNNYIATLLARDLASFEYLFSRISRNMTRTYMSWQTFGSPNTWAAATGDKMNGIIGGFLQDAINTITGVAPVSTDTVLPK
jgi:hypothetical protein